MKILVCITHVPDTTSKISFVEGNTKFNSDSVQYIIGPYDDYALARAVELKELKKANVTVLNIGGIESEPTLRKALAIGADEGIRVDTVVPDSLFVAKQIANVAKKGDYDLILMGKESIDYNGGQVHAMVGELLEIPSFSPVMKLDIDESIAKITLETEEGKEFLEVKMPCIIGCQEPIAEWKIPNMRGIMTARTKPLHIIPPIAEKQTIQTQTYELPAPKSGVKMANSVDELVDMLKNNAKIL